jgi:chorismate dehydratase
MSGNLRITAVSYLNTKPFLFGLFSSSLIDFLDIQLEIPSECARKLKSGEADLGLIPVGALKDLESYHIISDYCIGAVGRVNTVCLFSEVPVQQIEKIYLDYQSRTSVELIKILSAKHWKISPEFSHAMPGYTTKIQGTTGGLVIGDRVIPLLKNYEFVYDLSETWYQFTGGKPFVFAVWVSTKPMDPILERVFNNALKNGVDRVDDLCKILPNPYEDFDLKNYLKKDISYTFDDAKQEALSYFLELIKE